jgi:1-pyrroline-5-carboxylate dehydrogenase
MSNGIFNVPVASNEPIYDYAPGSPEREALLASYKEQYASTVDVPMYIVGKEVRTGNLGKLTPPHEHNHILGQT